MVTERRLPMGYYVYTITVDDLVRYIGKGKSLRLYSHMKEVRNRLNRDYRLQNIGSRLQRNLTKAVLSGAKVIEQVLVDNLTETAAYKLEYDKLREYVFAGKRDQLWNVIPALQPIPNAAGISRAVIAAVADEDFGRHRATLRPRADVMLAD
jgi:hypothetical protein